MNTYTSSFSPKATPQTEPIPGTAQVQNNAGGFTFAVDDWTRLDRFLILGSEGGSYYATERALTRESAQAVLRCIRAEPARAVARIVEISEAGRAPKNDPAIFALALALKMGPPPARTAAQAATTRVCRTGTHIFQLAQAVDALGGWGRGTKRAFARWYQERFNAYQAIKYQARGGWSHRDLLRKTHIQPRNPDEQLLYRWAAGKEVDTSLPPLLDYFERAKATASKSDILDCITEGGLPREAIPTEWLNDPDVWAALLENMPLTALIRNLGKMSSVGLLTPMSEAAAMAAGRLTDPSGLKAARVHPLQILTALETYRSGRGLKGSNTWTPVQTVVSALEAAFYAAFDNVTPSGKRHMLALDVSASMEGAQIAGSPLTARTASAAMALVTARTEAQHMLTCFSTSYRTLHEVTARSSLTDALHAVRGLPFGGTDCALPMLAALENRLPVDVFTVYTDSETWHGRIHPKQALDMYRQKSGIDAKLVVVGMVSNGFSIADPNDAGMLDVVGFDSAAPAVIADFGGGA